MPYDHLLIATGSLNPSEGLPGLREHGWPLKDSRDMQAFRAHLGRRIADGQPTTLAVIGGDCAGVEMAGVEMAAALQECLTHAGLPGEVHLVCSRGVMDCVKKKHAGLAAHARQSLERAGVKLHLGQRATGITAGGICLEDGSVLRADEVMYAARIALSVLPGTEGLPRDRTGRLLTDEFLRVQSEVRLWAGGDTARVRHLTAAGDYPTNGLWDMKQGLWAGRNMARSVQGQALRHFSYRGLGQTAGLGQGDAVAELFGMPLTGVLTWWLRGLFSVWHMPSKARQAHTFFERLRPSGMSVAPTPSPQPARDSELKVKEAQ